MHTMRKEAKKHILHTAITIVLMLLLTTQVDIASMSWADDSSCNTNKDEAFPTECTEALVEYPELMDILGKRTTIIIPGMKQTHIRNLKDGMLVDEACEVAVPQGITVVDDYLLLSAYCGKGKNEEEDKTHPSVLYVIDKANGKYITTITLFENGEKAVCELDGDSFSAHEPSINHVGGIAYDGSSRIFIAKSNDRNISIISKSRLISAIEKAKAQTIDGFAMSYDDSVSCDGYKASFVTWYDNKLFVGVFNKGVPNGLYGFTIGGEEGNLTAENAISYPISDYANGAVFFESNGRECLAVTRSPGRKTDSTLMLYEVSSNASSRKSISLIDKITLPPMAEEMTIDDGLMYTAFESASSLYSTKKYAESKKGVCKHIFDRICVADVNDVFYWVDNVALSADESSLSTAGAVLDSSTVTETSGNLIDKYTEVNGNYARHGDSASLATGFLYSDSMLMIDSTAGGEEGYTDLTKAGVALASAAYQGSNVYNMLAGMQYTKINQYNYGVTSTYEDNDRVAFSVAQKVVYKDRKRYVLYVVPVRGTYDSEWYSDFNLGKSGTHEGFKLSYDQVIDVLKKDFFESDGADSSTRKIFLTGHSRGAAVANMLAGSLTESSYVDQSGVFAYTFACPAVSKTASISYKNIYNFNYEGDVIPHLPLDDWGYKRYGATIEYSPDSNAGRRFQAEYGETFAGKKNTPTVVVEAIQQLVETEKDFHKEDNLLLFDTLALGLNDHPGSDDWEKILKKHGWGALFDVLKSTAGSRIGLGWFELLKKENNIWTELDQEIRAGQDNWTSEYKKKEEYGSTVEERWNNWKKDHTELINKIGEHISVEINEEDDLDIALEAVDDRILLYKDKPVAIITNALIVMLTTDNKPLTTITHGHTPENYMTAINSRYYGYAGWAGSNIESVNLSDTVNHGVVKGVGANCFSGCTSLTDITIPDGGIEYIGSNAFASLAQLSNIHGAFNINNYVGASAFKNCSGIQGTVKVDNQIGTSAFDGCSGIQEAIIGDRTEYIPTNAFNNCSGLLKVSMPISAKYSCQKVKGVTMMNVETNYYYSFSGCNNVEEIHFTAGNGDVMQYNWDDYSEYNSSGYGYTGTGSYEYGLPYITRGKLTKVVVEEGVTELPDDFLHGCSNVTDLSLPGTLKTIGACAFLACKLSADTVIPADVETIGTSAFSGCTGLVSVSIAGVSSVPAGIFNGCTSLISVTMPDDADEIGSSAFMNSGITSVTVPYGAKTIPESCFEGCANLVSATLPVTLTSIGMNAFTGSGIQQIVIPDKVDSIATNAFRDCSSLQKVTMPISAKYACYRVKSVSMMNTETSYYYSFSGCSNVSELCFTKGSGESAQYSWNDFSEYNSSGYGSTGTGSYEYGLPYIARNSLTTLTVDEGITELPVDFMRGCSNLENVSLPDTLKIIGSGAFLGCRLSANTVIPAGVEAIGGSAFSGCTGLVSVSIAGVSSVPSGIFNGCTNLTSVIMPEDSTELGSSAFRNSGVENIAVPEGVTTVPESCFEGCTNLVKVTLPKSLTSIERNAFLGSTLQEIVIPDNVVGIATDAFKNCSNLKKISLPVSAKYSCYQGVSYGTMYTDRYDYYSFSGCGNVEEIRFTKGNGEAMQYSWNDSSSSGYSCRGSYTYGLPYIARGSLTTVIVEDGVSEIPASLVYGCSNIETLTLPDTLKIIGSSAFNSCSKVTAVMLAGTIETIGSSAFPKTMDIYTVRDCAADTFAQSNGNKVYYINDPQIIAESDTLAPEESQQLSFTYVAGINMIETPSTGDWRIASATSSKTYITDSGLLTIGEDEEGPVAVEVTYKGHTSSHKAEFKIQRDPRKEALKKLNTLIAECEQIAVSDVAYTVESFTAFTDALARAKVAAANGSSTEAELIAAREDLLAAKDGLVIKVECAHEWDAGRVTAEPTCTDDGVMTYTCTKCSETRTEVIPAHGHFYEDESSYDTEPTCTEAGIKSIHCSVCGWILEGSEVEVPPLGHDWDEGVITVQPTETEYGVIVFTCRRCGETTTQQLEPADHQHVWNEEYTVDVEPTCTEPGIKSIHCSVCGDIRPMSETEIPAAGHEWEKLVEKATLTVDGVTMQQCKVCGEVDEGSVNAIPHPGSFKLAKTSYTYSGSLIKPAVTVKDLEGNVISAKHYSVVYSANKYVGQATATVTFNDEYYTGTKTLTFKINPKATAWKGLTATSKGFTAKWAKRTVQTSGYQLQYSTSSTFKTYSNVWIKKNSTVSKKITKLKAKKKYYVRIRAYKKVDGTKYYSAWTSKKSVTTKK